MIPVLVKLRGDVNELQEKVDALTAKVELLHEHDLMLVGQLEELSARNILLSAHVENLIERVYELEGENPIACTCAWIGQHGPTEHDPANPRCARNQRTGAPTVPESGSH